MKKIMFIMTKLGGPGWGGAHKVSVMLANYLVHHGYEVFFSLSDPQEGQMDYPLDQSIQIFDLSKLYTPSKIRAFSLLKKLKAFRTLCKREGIDVVVGFTSNMAIYSILATVGSKRKSLVSERTDPRLEPRKKILRGGRNLLFCFANHVVFQTPGAQQYYPRAVRKKSSIIPNPISNALLNEYHGERDCRIVNFCRISRQKNLKVLLEAFDIFAQKNGEYSLEIYGDAKEGDPYKMMLEQYVETLSSAQKIHFYPACSDVHQKVIRARMFASSSDYEGISNSMLEAMAIGLPVIVTDCQNGGERMCIESGENGVIVPRQDPQSLAAAMMAVAEDQELTDKLSVNAAKVRDRFCSGRIFNMWQEIIEDM